MTSLQTTAIFVLGLLTGAVAVLYAECTWRWHRDGEKDYHDHFP